MAAVALVSGSSPAAEDAVQEALLRARERSERGEHIESHDDVAGVTCGDLDERPALVQWYSASYDQWLLIQGSQLETLPGSELDLTAGMLDELCGAPVAVDRPPSLTAG